MEKSVLASTPHQDVNRYRMLRPIRYRGRVELARIGRDAEQGRRHKDFYLGLLAGAHDDWFGPQQLDALRRLRRESGNIGKALELCAVAPDNPDEGLMAGANLLEFGLVEGRFQQGTAMVRHAARGRLRKPGDQSTRPTNGLHLGGHARRH